MALFVPRGPETEDEKKGRRMVPGSSVVRWCCCFAGHPIVGAVLLGLSTLLAGQDRDGLVGCYHRDCPQDLARYVNVYQPGYSVYPADQHQYHDEMDADGDFAAEYVNREPMPCFSGAKFNGWLPSSIEDIAEQLGRVEALLIELSMMLVGPRRHHWRSVVCSLLVMESCRR